MAWETLNVVNIERAHILALLNDTAGAIRAQAFLTGDVCNAVLARLDAHPLEPYDPSRYPVGAYRLGPTLNEHNTDGGLSPQYWIEAEESRNTLYRQFYTIRPRSLLEAKLRRAWNGRLVAACIDRRSAYWPIIRELPRGTLLHWDDITHEYPSGLFDDRVQQQLALNVFLDAPSTGGELRLWKRQWRPTDEAHRVAFGYSADLLTQPPDIVLRAHQGDAVLFRPAYYHDVQASTTGRRITLSSFVGITASGLAVWA